MKRLSHPVSWVLFFVLLLLALVIPASAQTVPPGESTELSVSDRLDDRRYVASGTPDVIVDYVRQFSPINQQIEGRITTSP